jgi:hypothetical protein
MDGEVDTFEGQTWILSFFIFSPSHSFHSLFLSLSKILERRSRKRKNNKKRSRER